MIPYTRRERWANITSTVNGGREAYPGQYTHILQMLEEHDRERADEERELASAARNGVAAIRRQMIDAQCPHLKRLVVSPRCRWCVGRLNRAEKQALAYAMALSAGPLDWISMTLLWQMARDPEVVGG